MTLHNCSLEITISHGHSICPLKINYNLMKFTTKLIAFALLMSFIHAPSKAQEVVQDAATATIQPAQACEGVAGIYSDQPSWMPRVSSLRSKVHFAPDADKVRAAKALPKTGQPQTVESGRVAGIASPVLGLNYEANWSVTSTPPDNSMAISNAGRVVTVNNDGIEYYSATGAFQSVTSWFNFFNNPTLNANLYDPVVMYDPDVDRFFMVVLHGTTASNSRILLCFSQSNDPSTNGWWVYNLTGNQLNNNCWFDYPAIGISTNDVFVTGNLFASTTDVFNQAIILQMPKTAGYAGQTINNITTWSNLNSTPYAPFTLIPASTGRGSNVGPGLRFVSSAAGGDNRLRLWHINNSAGNNPTISVATINVPAYSPVSGSPQPNTANILDNGDCRMHDAFEQDGIIHYTFHTNIGNNWNGIRYGRITISNNNHASTDFGFQGTADCSYPAMASVSDGPGNQSVVIAFHRASSTIFPELRVVTCNHALQWSASTLVKAGETFVNILASNDERWGDYTGAMRRFNSNPPRVWIAGCYGAAIPSQNAPNTFKTWVAEVSGGTTAVGIPLGQESLSKAALFPNPVYDIMNLEYSLSNKVNTRISIYDMNGKEIKLLFTQEQAPGDYRLSFNRGALSSGTYVLKIWGNEESLYHVSVIVE